MTDRPFDRAAGYYDLTRDLPEPLATLGMDALAHYARPQANALVLEVGAGTGRISLPLLQRGVRLVGIDLARPMLARLRQKAPEARLAEANAVQLPFGAAQFDGLVTIHVLHLIGRWREALREFRRVLKPGAAYVNSWHAHPEASIDQVLRNYWRSRVEAHGAQWRRPGIQSREELLEEAHRMGAGVEELVVTEFANTLSPLSVVEGIASRVFSDTWEVPDDVFALTIDELRRFAAATYSDLTTPRVETYQFLLDVVRF